MGIPHELILFYCRILITTKKCVIKERYSRKRELIPLILYIFYSTDPGYFDKLFRLVMKAMS